MNSDSAKLDWSSTSSTDLKLLTVISLAIPFQCLSPVKTYVPNLLCAGAGSYQLARTDNLSKILPSGCVMLWFIITVPASSTELLQPISGRDNGVFCYINEVTLGMALGHLRIGPGCQRKQACDWRLEFSMLPLLPLDPWGGRGARGWISC